MFSLGLGLDTLLFAVGVVWWRQLLRRAREDFQAFRDTREATEKAAIAILWSVSAAWGLWSVGFITGVVRGLL